MKRLLLVLAFMPIIMACDKEKVEKEEKGEEVSIKIATLTDDGYYDGLFYYKITSRTLNEVSVIKSDTYQSSLVIPSAINIYGVIYSCTSIEPSAFYKFHGLTSITFPNSVTTIGDNAFYGCSGLTSITIPNSVKSIGSFAFDDCHRLTSITIPNKVSIIERGTFSGCKELASITIPYSVKIIEHSAFYYCTGLTSITIPNSVTYIGEGAFWNCTGLTSLIVEDGNNEYDSRGNCNAIIETANNTLIFGCKNTIIPNSVTNIRSRAFAGCSGLTSITIPEGVTKIGSDAFIGCSNLTSVFCKGSTPPSCLYAFTNVSSIILYVPKGSKSTYQNVSPWNNFKEIIEEEN